MNKVSNYLASQFKQFDAAAIVLTILLACIAIGATLYVERPKPTELNDYGDKLPLVYFSQ